MNHWIARSDGGIRSSGVNSAFAEAQSTGGPVIYSFFMYQLDDMRGLVATLHDLLEDAEASYPDVTFKYATALDAIQTVTNCIDTTPPTLSLTGNTGTYTIVSKKHFGAIILI